MNLAESGGAVRKILAAVVFLAASVQSFGATVTAASCTMAAIDTAIGAAVSGDTVTVPTGSFTANTTITIPSTKGITLSGPGMVTPCTITTATNQNAITFASHATDFTRITGFKFVRVGAVANDGQATIITSGTTTSPAFRIDNNDFTAAANNTAEYIATQGNGPGLIDHNTFTAPHSSEMIHNLGNGSGSTAGWTDDVTPGGPNMVFVEDNTFTYSQDLVNYPSMGDNYFWGTSAVQAYYGARTVIRHNTLNMVQVDMHGTVGSVGARWYEIYSNVFNTNYSPTPNQSSYMDLRAGSGLVYDNTHTGANLGSGTVVFREEDVGTWPLAFQVGSGINGQTNQHSTCGGGTRNQSPAYSWNNSPIASADGSKVQLNRDLFVSVSQPSALFRQQLGTDDCSTTYAYTAYTYPYPWGVTCTPDRLAFTAQPSSAVLGASLGTVSVSLENSSGQICNGHSASITLAKSVGSTWGTLASGSSLTKTTSGGTSTWTDLSVSGTIGTGSITATSPGLIAAHSNERWQARPLSVAAFRPSGTTSELTEPQFPSSTTSESFSIVAAPVITPPVPPALPMDSPPVPGGAGAIDITSVSSSKLSLSWSPALDDKPGLLYEVRRSYYDNMHTVTEAEYAGTVIKPYTLALSSYTATGLSSGYVYRFTVIVKDSAGQKSVYKTATARYGWSGL